MLVSKQQFWIGGDSRPRNEIIMKLFRLLGMSERQGFGGPLIYKTAMQNDYRRPEITSDIEHTEIKVWNIDLADSYPNLSEDEKSVLRFIAKSNRTPSIKNIKEAVGISDYATRKVVQSLEEFHLIRKIGSGPSTAYTLQVDSIEFLTQLQVAMEQLKKQMQ
jgi:predicted HTH transcriptional regulator